MISTRPRRGAERRWVTRCLTAGTLCFFAVLLGTAPVLADGSADDDQLGNGETAAAEAEQAGDRNAPRKLGRLVVQGRYAHASPWFSVSRHGWAIQVGGWPPVIVHEDGAYRPGAALGALDLDVSPEEAEIYIDGEYYGIADNYDGFPTYLWLEEGVYDLELYLDGYETVGMQITVEADEVIEVDNRLDRGESRKPRLREQTVDVQEPVEAPEWSEGSAGEAEQASLVFAVSPSDAVIYLDGHFFGTADELALSEAGWLVSVGGHEIEVLRPGYVSLQRSVDLTAGERLRLEVALEPSGSP